MTEIYFYKYKGSSAITSRDYNTATDYEKIDSATYGIHLGKDTASTLLAPAPMKSDITNDCAVEDGVRFVKNTHKTSRSLTLEFVIAALTPAKRQEAENALLSIFYNGFFGMQLPSISNDIYFLSYNSSQSYARSISGCVVKLSVKCTEYNPLIRFLAGQTNETK